MLSACHFGAPKTPTGQVVATVGTREITRRELQVEMDGSSATTPAAQKAQQQAALQRIIQRVILANAAKAQGLDKDPNFALLSQRADEALLGQLLERRTAASVPAPSAEEADQFQQTNPNLFSERKLFDVDQIRMARPSDPQIVAKLQPFKTLDEIANYLNQNQIPFQRGANVMDSLGQNPKLLSAILALPPHEVFILSSANEVFVNEIRDTRTSPFAGDVAKRYALNSLKAQHVQDAVTRQLRGIVAKGSATVRVNKEFEPPKTPVKKAQQN
jgi:EpsD family peptidyl-prolyl cis-trans isomerase